MRVLGVGFQPGLCGADGGEVGFPDAHVLRVEQLGEGDFVLVDDGPGVGLVEEFPVAKSGVAEDGLRDIVDGVHVVEDGGHVATCEEGVRQEAGGVEVGHAGEGGGAEVVGDAVDFGMGTGDCVDDFHDAVCD